MSRSYKKNPVVTDGSSGSTQHSKKIANRKLRRHLNNSDELLQGSKYKRHSESYEIHDWKFRYTWEDAKEYYEIYYDREDWIRKEYPTIKDYYRWWVKTYRRK